MLKYTKRYKIVITRGSETASCEAHNLEFRVRIPAPQPRKMKRSSSEGFFIFCLIAETGSELLHFRRDEETAAMFHEQLASETARGLDEVSRSRALAGYRIALGLRASRRKTTRLVGESWPRNISKSKPLFTGGFDFVY